MSGNLTAPALYAMQHGAHGNELRALIDSEFNEAGGLPRAIELVRLGGGIEQARTLARRQAEQVPALGMLSSALLSLPFGVYQVFVGLCVRVV